MHTKKITIHAEVPKYIETSILTIIWEDALEVATKRSRHVAGEDAAACFKILEIVDGRET